MEKAAQNRAKINQIRTDLMYGRISYDEAIRLATPMVEEANKKARELAKKYNMRPQLVSVKSVLR